MKRPAVITWTVVMSLMLAVWLSASGTFGPVDLRQSAPAPRVAAVTFTEHIAPILYDNCVTCHRPGEAAPFALISYEDAAKRAQLLTDVTKSRYMPPWHAEPGFGDFADERRLTDAQIDSIAEWVKQGMPRGSTALPKLPAENVGVDPKLAGGWPKPPACGG